MDGYCFVWVWVNVSSGSMIWLRTHGIKQWSQNRNTPHKDTKSSSHQPHCTMKIDIFRVSSCWFLKCDLHAQQTFLHPDIKHAPGSQEITSRLKNLMWFILQITNIAWNSLHRTTLRNNIKSPFLKLKFLFQVDFDQFKNALILILSSTTEPQQTEQESLSKPGKIWIMVFVFL